MDNIGLEIFGFSCDGAGSCLSNLPYPSVNLTFFLIFLGIFVILSWIKLKG